ncbi:MAG: bis(5'-nucleosyl)-tetraphosphatase (symmetrical) YqeK [Spirochaetota bacterium]|nr:MAG: bis(5'-nucleosyl)-tetraphosphatase (symmetrical) YqeK [Spirochaetota bacterium]
MKSIEKGIRSYITEERFSHSQGVRDTAVSLAIRYQCDEEKASIAALLHDVARDLSLERMQRIVKSNCGAIYASDIVFNNPGLLHARAGRIIAQEEFDVQDEDILQSIELHTTGGEGMSLLNKVVFIADYTEPGRKFRGVGEARKLARRSIDETVLYIFKSMISKLIQKGVYICKETLLGYNEHVLDFKGDAIGRW